MERKLEVPVSVSCGFGWLRTRIARVKFVGGAVLGLVNGKFVCLYE